MNGQMMGIVFPPGFNDDMGVGGIFKNTNNILVRHQTHISQTKQERLTNRKGSSTLNAVLVTHVIHPSNDLEFIASMLRNMTQRFIIIFAKKRKHRSGF